MARKKKAAKPRISKADVNLTPEFLVALAHFEGFWQWYDGNKFRHELTKRNRVAAVIWAACPASEARGYVNTGADAVALTDIGWGLSGYDPTGIELPYVYRDEVQALPAAGMQIIFSRWLRGA